MPIRAVRKEDHDAIWQILEPAIRAGDTYPLPRDMDKAEAIPHWTDRIAGRSLRKRMAG